MRPTPPDRCPVPLSNSFGVLTICQLERGHRGLHTATVMWDTPADDAPTAKLPPIRESIGPRRRPPAIEELTGRAALIEAMQAELRAELRELREDQADDDGDRS